MSGVYIKGMDMPKSCGKCKLFCASQAFGLFAPLGWCNVDGKEIFCLSEKADFCPLVPVPPHGDLIDRSKIEYTYAMQGGVLMTSNKIIDRLPSIIPQE